MNALRPTVVLLVALATIVSAQRRPAGFPSLLPPLAPSRMVQQSAASEPRTEVPMALGGVVGGAIGLFGGGLVGYELGGGGRVCGDDSCGFLGMFLGAAVGEVIMLPLGVHVGNGKRGSYGAAFAASTAVAVGGLLILGQADVGEAAVILPIGQIVAAMLAEKAAARQQ